MLVLDGIRAAYRDSQPVLCGLSLQLAEGQLGCLVGPSGCGKTTLLRLIAGFEPVLAGRVLLRGHEVSAPGFCLVPERRRVGMVFQDFALFPHLSVADNIGFGLRRQSPGARRERVAEMLALVGLPGHEARYVHALSGGQQQRIALARALAPRPDLLLLDEPFSSLDAELRETLSLEVRNILKHEGVTALMVTHDQHEAFAMADQVGVVAGGQLVQWGSPYALYHEPKTRFVADFIGRGVFVQGQMQDGQRVQTCLGLLERPRAQGLRAGDRVEVLVRPDDIIYDPDSPIRARVLARAFRGADILYTLAAGNGERLLCLVFSHHNHALGEEIGIRAELNHLVVFPKLD